MLFGKNKRLGTRPESGPAAADPTAVAEEIRTKALAAEVEVLATVPEVMRSAEAEHAQDAASYQFECRRWGDFLSLMIKRTSLTGALRSIAVAVNIRETPAMELVAGHAPDMGGMVTYELSCRSEDGGWSSWSGMGLSPAPDGCEYVVTPCPPWRVDRAMFRAEPEVSHMWGGVSHVPHITEPFPRYAQDDEVRFLPGGAAIFCPFGSGQRVYDQILAEIGDFMKEGKK